MPRELFSVDELKWIDFDSEELHTFKTRQIERREKKVKVKSFTEKEQA